MKKLFYSTILVLFIFCCISDLSLAKEPGQSSDSSLKPQYGGVLKVIWRRCPANLGAPHERTYGGYMNAAYPVMDTLMDYDRNGNPLPDLAEEIKIAPDGKSITLFFRKGVKFHDGTDFDAEAVKYQIEVSGTPYSLLRLTSVDVLDRYTARLNLSEFDCTLISNLALSTGLIGSPTASKKPVTPENRAKEHTIGTGPFKFVDWERDVFIKYERFNNYWDKGKPYLDGMEYKYIADPTVASMAFQAGEAQIIYDVEPKEARNLEAKGFVVSSSKFFGTTLVSDGANTDSPFADRRVREAVEYAIDKKAIAESLGHGYWEAVNQICSPNSPMGYVPDIKGREYNPARAKELLAAAGFPNGFETRIIAATTEEKDFLVALQSYFNEVGIKAKIDLAERGRLTAMHKEGWKNGLLVDMFEADPNFPVPMVRFYSEKTVRNRSMLRPPEFQETLDQSVTAVDFQKRQALSQKMVRMVHDEAMVTPLWLKARLVVLDKSVHGSSIHEMAHPFLWTPANIWLSR